MSAKRKLIQLENNQVATSTAQPDMFQMDVPETVPLINPLLDAFENIQPDELTPKQALDLLYKLKNLTI